MLSRSKIFYYEVLQKVSSSNNHMENRKGGNEYKFKNIYNLPIPI